MLAAMNGNFEVVDRLIKDGADPNQTNKYGDSPLKWAAKNGHLEVVDRLIKGGATSTKQTKMVTLLFLGLQRMVTWRWVIG